MNGSLKQHCVNSKGQLSTQLVVVSLTAWGQAAKWASVAVPKVLGCHLWLSIKPTSAVIKCHQVWSVHPEICELNCQGL